MGVIEPHLLEASDKTGASRATVVPAYGSNVVAWTFQHRELQEPLPVLESVDLESTALRLTSFGIPLMAPAPGRIGSGQSGRFSYRGHEYVAASKRHGFFRDVPWDVGTHSKNAIECTHRFSGGTANAPLDFPFDLFAKYKITLHPHSLSLELAIQNTGDVIQPVSLGWHPYLHRRGNCTVRLPASSIWRLDGNAEPVPTGEVVAVEGLSDFRQGRLLEKNEAWDDVFTGLETPDGVVSCVVEEEASKALIRRSVNFHNTAMRHVQLFTPKGRDAICVEPLSSPPNALNLLAQGHPHADVTELAPGEVATFRVDLGIDVEFL